MALWKMCGRELDCGTVRIMGILNVTPDSFFDGGQYAAVEGAVAHARAMVAAGADILDVGGQSTRPGHTPCLPDEEWSRLRDVLPAVCALGVPVSVDTYYPEVARRAVAAGAVIVNDVSGSLENGMLSVAAEAGVGLVLMAPCADVRAYFEQATAAAAQAGVAAEQLCLDVGIGFGKTREQDRQTIAALPQLVAGFGRPVLVGASRKRVTGEDVPPEQRLGGTLALHTLAQWQGASVLRVHDVREAVQAARLTAQIRQER